MVSMSADGSGDPAARGLNVEGLDIDYEGRALLTDVSLSVHHGEILALLGPSGSGKSSLLRCIAGIQQPRAGRITWDGEDITGLPAHRRRIGLVFQDPLLFPHLSVGANIAIGLRGDDRDRDRREERVEHLLDLVGLPGFARRSPETLSGGEARRIALARALAPQPRCLLLDEPFGALDRALRDRLATDVRDLLHRLGTPAILVTHDPDEARLVADRTVLIDDLGSPPPAARE